MEGATGKGDGEAMGRGDGAIANWKGPSPMGGAMGKRGGEAMDRGDGAMVTKEEPPT